MNLEVNHFYNEENKWTLSDVRIFDDKDNMIEAQLFVIDNEHKLITGIDDVWIYNWTPIE